MTILNIQKFDVDNFSAALQTKDKQLVIYFSAPWCQPCKNVRPVFIRFASEHTADNVIFGEVNIAVSPTIAQTYGIKSVPSIAVFYQNQIVKIIPGEIGSHELNLLTDELNSNHLKTDSKWPIGFAA